MNRKTQRRYQLQAEVIQAAGHPIRLAIINYLKGGEQCVCDIAEHVGGQALERFATPVVDAFGRRG